MEEKKKITEYIVVEKTLKELYDIAVNGDNKNKYSVQVYEHKIEREPFDEKQEKIQLQNKWNTELNSSFRIGEDSIYNLVKKFMFEELKNGTKENLVSKVKDAVMNSKARAMVYVIDNKCDNTKNARVDLEFGDKSEEFVYVEDEKEMDKALAETAYKMRDWKNNNEEYYVYLEDVKVDLYVYNFTDILNKTDRLIKRFLRNELTYCLKNEKVIVPQEYLDKGEEGIKEWRELKASKNKNNNMEKRMLRQMLRDKKYSILMQMRNILWRFPTGQDARDWSVPHLTIYGNGNKAMAQKLVNQVLGKMTDQEILNTTDEEISKKFKEYWKGILNKTIEQLDDVITYGDKY